MSDNKITYDPSKRYTWTPNDKFELNGNEFGAVLNLIRAILSTAEAGRILLAAQTNDLIEGILAKAVEAGQVKEAPEEAPKTNL